MQVILSPVVTEKSLIKVANGTYVFEVALKANKIQIARAIEDLYKVKVVKVNAIRRKGKIKTGRGRYETKLKDVKIAMISLKKGDKIPGYEEK